MEVTEATSRPVRSIPVGDRTIGHDTRTSCGLTGHGARGASVDAISHRLGAVNTAGLAMAVLLVIDMTVDFRPVLVTSLVALIVSLAAGWVAAVWEPGEVTVTEVTLGDRTTEPGLAIPTSALIRVCAATIWIGLFVFFLLYQDAIGPPSPRPSGRTRPWSSLVNEIAPFIAVVCGVQGLRLGVRAFLPRQLRLSATGVTYVRTLWRATIPWEQIDEVRLLDSDELHGADAILPDPRGDGLSIRLTSRDLIGERLWPDSNGAPIIWLHDRDFSIPTPRVRSLLLGGPEGVAAELTTLS